MSPVKEITKVSAIVCAYNEQKHIKQTIIDLLKCPTAQEVIVVNDGSSDKTEEILKSFGKKIRLISYKKNRGKGFALAQGVKAARGEIVIFLDAHLKNLKDKHLQELVEPILKRKANYALGYAGSKKVKRPAAVPFTHLTGQRAYLREILVPFLSHLKKTRFGVETYLNEIFKPRWAEKIPQPDLIHFNKPGKMPRNEVLPAYLQEVIEISKTKLEIRMDQHKQLKKILNPKKIKSIKVLREKVNEIKDKEVSELIKNHIIPYLKRISR